MVIYFIIVDVFCFECGGVMIVWKELILDILLRCFFVCMECGYCLVKKKEVIIVKNFYEFSLIKKVKDYFLNGFVLMDRKLLYKKISNYYLSN